jgi:hypothetical protein
MLISSKNFVLQMFRAVRILLERRAAQVAQFLRVLLLSENGTLFTQ